MDSESLVMVGEPARKRPESVLVVVYSADALVLMLRRHEPPTFWQSVTGSLEWGEEPEQAARRELAEETGLDAAALEDCHDSHLFEIYEIWLHRYAKGVRENREHVFRLEVPGACPVILDVMEHAEYEWLPRQQAARRASSPTNRQAILDWVPVRPHPGERPISTRH